MCILSVIVPVYNVEKYLKKCVDSIMNQDLASSEYEVILVNDGSTDNSYNIALELSKTSSNIKIISQTNQGLSSARNSGMREALGKYIMFVDSDDYLQPNCLKRLITVCEENQLDICHFRLTCLRPKGDFMGSIGNLHFDTIYTGKAILTDGMLIGSACSNIYNTSFLHKFDLYFHVGITHEDVEFTTRLFCHVKRVLIIRDTIYYYIYNDKSLSKDVNFEKQNKFISDSAVIAALARDYANNNVDDIEIRNLVLRRVNSSVIGSLVGLIKNPKLPESIVANLVEKYYSLKLLPLKGHCLKWYMTFIGHFFSNRSVFLFFYNFRYNGKG
jgi:glycosyltransferase involved in cell wall biosynthesis